MALLTRPQPSVLKCHVNISCHRWHPRASEAGPLMGCSGNMLGLLNANTLIISQQSREGKGTICGLSALYAYTTHIFFFRLTGYQEAVLKENMCS